MSGDQILALKWDEIERELRIIEVQLHRLANTLGAGADALRREREAARVTPNEVHEHVG